MSPKKPSPSRTYVVPTEVDGFTRFTFKKFTLPENVENTCEFATWYFYNRLDSFSCGSGAYPIEQHEDIVTILQV